jgi:hypothetical protein
MTSGAFRTSRFAFLCFTFQLFILQFTAAGLHAYFSMYVSREWVYSGYLLYAALIYLFFVYSIALFQEGQFLTGGLQLMSLGLLVAVMLYPYDSIDHVSLLPFLAALQPIILFTDYRSRNCDDVYHARSTLHGIIILLIVSPVIFVLMFFPIIEKILIYGITALLFATLQSKIGTREKLIGLDA